MLPVSKKAVSSKFSPKYIRASTLASNSPGGIINMISKTGEEEGGSVAVTSGLDYDSWRTDFAYGAPMGDGWSFHVGGFYREGDGPRDVGYTAQSGGQVKFNITKDFDTGYARVYFKHLDDESIGYLPMPMKSDGGSIKNFDALEDSPHTPYLLSNIGVNSNGNLRKSNVKEGMHPETTAVGAEFEFELANDWRINVVLGELDKLRKSPTLRLLRNPSAAPAPA